MTIEATIDTLDPDVAEPTARTTTPRPPDPFARLRTLWRAYVLHNEREWARAAESQARRPTID